MPFAGLTGAAGAAGSVKRILSSSWVETYGGNVSLNGTLDRLVRADAGPSRHVAVGLAIAAFTLALVAASAAGAGRAGKRVRPSAAVDATLAATLLGASTSWLHHSAILFPAAAAAAPPAQAAVVALYAVAAAWRGFASIGAGGGIAASLAGTAALVVLWLLACRRVAEPC